MTRCCSTRPRPCQGFPGPNGIQVFQNEVYVSVSDRGHVVAFRINADGSAGTGRVHVVLGVDDFAFDVQGNLYAMTNFSQMVVRVTPGGATETLLAFLWAGRTVICGFWDWER